MTVAWTPDELERIGRAEELHIAAKRPDGTLRPEVPIWVVRSGAQLYVRTCARASMPPTEPSTAATAKRPLSAW
jgi:hypothetical protein